MKDIMLTNQKNQEGMTLVEMVVTVGLLAIIAVIVVTSFPVQRDQQQLLAAQQQIQSYVRQAQQMALDQQREDDCVNAVANQSLCSKIGVAFRGNEVRFFADTNDDNRFNDSDREIVHMRTSLPDVVQVVPANIWHSFIFEARPPTIVMFYNGKNLFASTTGQPISIRTSRGSERALRVHPYAQVERQN